MEFAQIDKYELRRIIGNGASGDVYEAFDPELKRTVALKIQSAHLAVKPEMRALFEEEARKAARVEHPNIVKVYELGHFLNRPYFTMEFMAGGTLKRLLMEKSRLDETNALEIIRQIAQALSYAHSHGYVHRDVKPENILFDPHGIFKITDFGIARGTEGSAPGMTLGYGGPVGTPEYMAPEQIDGRARSQSDLYSLGIILYELVTGNPPFPGDDPAEIFEKHKKQDVPMQPLKTARVSKNVTKLIFDLLKKRSKERLADGQSLVKRINFLLGTESNGGLQQPGGSPSTRGTKQKDLRKTLRNGAFIISGLLVATAIFVVLIPYLPSPPPPQSTRDTLSIVGTWSGKDPSSGLPLFMELRTDLNVNLQAGNRTSHGSFSLISEHFPYRMAFNTTDGQFNAVVDSVSRDSITMRMYGGVLFPIKTADISQTGSVAYRLGRTSQIPGQPPLAPVPLFPADRSVTIASPVTLRWHPSAGADSYTIEIARSADYSRPVDTRRSVTDSVYSTASLSGGTRFFWRVNATGKWGTGEWSSSWSFTTAIETDSMRTFPPDPPEPLSPGEGETGVGIPVTLQWRPSPRAASYAVQIAGSENFSSIVAGRKGMTGTSFRQSHLTNNTRYFWRINATGRGGTSEWSPTRSFSTADGPPPPPPPPPRNPWVLIKGGTFVFGDDVGVGKKNEMGNLADSTTVATFKLTAREISQSEYVEVMKSNPSTVPGSGLPVTNVTWEQAQQYCKTIGGRLPTEAEWEYAAKTGSDLVDGRYALYPWGDDRPASSRAVYTTRSPAPAGSHRQGRHGLFDMSGNVAEWCSDSYKENHYGATPENPSRKVVKGGAYNSEASRLRCAAREDRPAGQGYEDVGFRCAR